MNKFRAWVLEKSVEEVAKKLRKHPRAVYYWLNSKASPPARIMEKLVLLGDGAFSYQDVIDCTIHRKK